MTTIPEPVDGAETAIITVSPSRMACGTYDRQRNRDVGAGDIYASYSADTISSAGKIRKAFRWQAQLMVTTGLSGIDGIEQAEAYRLVPLKTFNDVTMSYSEKIGTFDNAEAARNDPNGFYHGVTVRQGSETFVLFGPPVVFIAEEPERPNGATDAEPAQLSLF